MTEQEQTPTPTPPTSPTTQEAPKDLPLPPPPALPYTFKANLTTYRKAIGPGRIVLALAISLIFWLRFGFIAWVLSLVVVAAAIFITLKILANRSVTLKSDEIEYKNGFGTVKKLRYDEISSVKVFAQYLDMGFGLMPRVIVGKKSGGYLMSLVGIFWPDEGLNNLLATIQDKKVDSTFYPEPASSAAITKEFPTLVPYYERHPYWFAFYVVMAILVGVTVYVLLTW